MKQLDIFNDHEPSNKLSFASAYSRRGAIPIDREQLPSLATIIVHPSWVGQVLVIRPEEFQVVLDRRAAREKAGTETTDTGAKAL